MPSPCRLCRHAHSEKHRLLPGCWGGKYEAGNVIPLCPNHHVAIHFLMDQHMAGGADGDQSSRLDAYRSDPALWGLWTERVRPMCEARKVAVEKANSGRLVVAGRPNPRRMGRDAFLALVVSLRAMPMPSGFSRVIREDVKARTLSVTMTGPTGACEAFVYAQQTGPDVFVGSIERFVAAELEAAGT